MRNYCNECKGIYKGGDDRLTIKLMWWDEIWVVGSKRAILTLDKPDLNLIQRASVL